MSEYKKLRREVNFFTIHLVVFGEPCQNRDVNVTHMGQYYVRKN